jgi:hypothetical protein
MPASVLIVNFAVLFAVLESDLGTRKVSTLRIFRPMLLGMGLVPLFIQHPATNGSGEALELALTGLGILLGIVASTRLMRIDYDEGKDRIVSRAGLAYGLFWATIIAARILFVYGANHWYTAQLVHWLSTNGISADALTDSLIFMAIAMAVSRSLRLLVGRVRCAATNSPTLAVQS